MTTSSVSAPIQHTTDAEFRAWATELYNGLIAVGLTQTGDTGQLATPVVAARPAINTDAGYWIFRFNDAQQGSAPIYFRLAVGTAGTANIPRVQLTLGTTSNGSGTVSGAGIATQNLLANGGATGATNRTTRMCYVAGFLGIQWKIGAANAGGGCLYIQRTVDNTGVATAGGASYILGSPGTGTAAPAAVGGIDYTTSTAYDAGAVAADRYSVYIPCGLSASSTTAAGDVQAFQMWGANRKLFPLWATPAVLRTEFSDGATFTTPMVGTTNRTYITGGSIECSYPESRQVAWMAMIWE